MAWVKGHRRSRGAVEERAPGFLLAERAVFALVGLPLLFAYAQVPRPVGYYFFPLTFLTLLVLYLPLARRWRELSAHVAGFAFCAVLSLAGTVTALATHSVGWTLLVVVVGPFAVMTVVALFVLPVVAVVKRRRDGV